MRALAHLALLTVLATWPTPQALWIFHQQFQPLPCPKPNDSKREVNAKELTLKSVRNCGNGPHGVTPGAGNQEG